MLNEDSVLRGEQRGAGTDLPYLYSKYFYSIDADTPELRTEAYRIRHRVYCIDHGYETASVEALEHDRFDSHSAHALLVYRPTELAAGTVRIVLPKSDAPDQSFATQEVCTDRAIRDHRRLPLQTMGEISRFCVPRDFVCKVRPLQSNGAHVDLEIDAGEWSRVMPNLTLGLFQWLVRFSRRTGLTHWCAVMEPRFLRRIARLGIHARPLGEPVQFHGLRQPCVVELESMLRRMRRERPDAWRVVTAAGAMDTCESSAPWWYQAELTPA